MATGGTTSGAAGGMTTTGRNSVTGATVGTVSTGPSGGSGAVGAHGFALSGADRFRGRDHSASKWAFRSWRRGMERRTVLGGQRGRRRLCQSIGPGRREVGLYRYQTDINQCTGSASAEDSKGCSTYATCKDGVQVTLGSKKARRSRARQCQRDLAAAQEIHAPVDSRPEHTPPRFSESSDLGSMASLQAEAVT